MTDKKNIAPELLNAIRKAQKDEETGVLLYAFMAGREKNSANRDILETMSEDEAKHAAVWKKITGENIRADAGTVFMTKVRTVLLGFTFTVKTMQKNERMGQQAYLLLEKEFPEAASMLRDERHHEEQLSGMLDEERLHYVGSIVLGLNDALVELTGAIAGVTFALANTKLVAMTGLVTGVSATLSMAASNYLAERASGNKNAAKSSLYPGIAYLIPVALLALPYLLLPSQMYFAAFIIMIAVVLLIILAFNYYISVAKGEPFLSRFAEMAAISLSVAVISFLIGIAAKNLLGINAG